MGDEGGPVFTDPFLFSGGSALPSELGAFISLALFLAVAAVLLAGRGGDDPQRTRPAARYLGGVCLFTLFVTLFASFGVVFSLTDLMVNHQDRFDEYNSYYEEEFEFDITAIEGETTFIPVGTPIFDYSSERTNNGNYTNAFACALVALTTGAVFLFHAKKRKRFMASSRGQGDIATRIDRVYHYGCCGVAALTAAFAMTSSIFGIYELIAPGTALGGGADITQAEGISEFLSWGVLAVASILIFLRHWHRVSADLGLDEPAVATA
jgi:hypothetical protein